MQKMEHLLWRGIVTAITAAVIFFLTYRYTSAEEIAGEEVYFTHSHVAGCKTVESVSCSRNHSFWLHRSEKGTYHCSSCNAQTTHNIETDVHRCADTGDTWQENSYTKCSICGTIHSTWGGPPGNTHFYDKEKINCGLSQGERTSSVKIVADGAWTNQGVTLTAKRTVLKNDSSGSVSFNWEGGSLFVTENGTYTVSAVNGAGASVTASIEINCIDKTVPVILSVSGDTQGMTAGGISILVEAEDGESGLADAPYSFDGGATWTAGSSFWLEEGRPVSLRVRDKAGNTSERMVRRGDFPYPPQAPTPPPVTPAPQPTPVPQPSDTKAESGTTNVVPQPSAGGEEGNGSGEPSENKALSGSNNTAPNGNENNKSGKPEGGKGSSEKPQGGKTGRGKIENGKMPANAGGNGKDTPKQNGSSHGASLQKGPQPAILKENIQGSSARGGFRVVRMDKAQAAGMAGAGTLKESTEAMAAYMQAVTGTGTAQDGLQNEMRRSAQEGQNSSPNDAQSREESAGTGARYALTGGLTGRNGRANTGPAHEIVRWIIENAGLAAGVLLFGFGLFRGCGLLWLYSVELYCYDGGNEYRRLGLLHIKKRKKELELYLPDYMLAKTGVPRYRLVVKDRLVKRFGKMDLVVYSDEHRLCRPLEDCVDFVL